MDILAIAIIVSSIVIGMHMLKRAQERTQRQETAYTLLERLNCYATYRRHQPSS